MATKGKKILIAEDDPFLGKIIHNRLKEEGYDVIKANNGEEALKLIEENGISLALLDLIMPVKDGFEVLKTIQQNKLKLPVLVFSNLSQEEDKEEAKKLGAKEFFVKSDISIDDLVKVVDSYA